MKRILWEEMRKLTLPKCLSCKNGRPDTLCCERVFCERVREMLKAHNITGYVWNDSAELPYMGDGGCTVASYHRPICAAFVCGYHLDEDPEFKRQYVALSKACFETEDPPIPK